MAMQKTVTTWAGVLAFAVLSACGGDKERPEPKPPAGNASLAVTIAGLPGGVAGNVKVSGPDKYAQSLTRSQTLNDLAAGNYFVNAEAVLSGTASYTPSAAAQTVVLPAGATATVAVSYSQSALALVLREVASVSDAVFLTAPADDKRQFIVERKGRIRVLEDGKLVATPFLDISSRVAVNGEGGMLSLAFHPQYASNGYFFVYYTNSANDIVVERYQVGASRNVANATSQLEIIRIAHPNYSTHLGGLLSFGPDGMLYLVTGDGGGAGDPQGNAQNSNSLLGKMLRLDVANASAGQRYAIPSSNPFLNQTGKRAEIWALGLRNPWRYAFDANNVYIADVGQGLREEVDISGVAQAGLNYGWNAMEGSICYNGSNCNRTGLTLPVHEYEHGAANVNGCSITGGYVYRGKAIPELAGRYFYSDYCAGYLKSFVYSGNAATELTDWKIASVGAVLSFGRDADGELYVLASSGKIYRIERAAKA